MGLIFVSIYFSDYSITVFHCSTQKYLIFYIIPMKFMSRNLYTKPQNLFTIKNFEFQHLSWVVACGENHPFEKYHFLIADQP